MASKFMERLGYLTNAVSIGLFFYLSSVLNVPDIVHYTMYIGWGLLIFGALLVALSAIALSRRRGAGLIEDGIFGLVRHPMYLGAILMYLSFPLFVPHWLLVVVAAINIAIVYAFILQGETINQEKFGEEYGRYQQEVPRMNLVTGIVRRLRRTE
jgi:protein-S-isoprenylcysteine O-methyltransferase Ste14